MPRRPRREPPLLLIVWEGDEVNWIYRLDPKYTSSGKFDAKTQQLFDVALQAAKKPGFHVSINKPKRS